MTLGFTIFIVAIVLFIMDRLEIHFDYDTILELWDGIYFGNSGVTINNETYTKQLDANTIKNLKEINYDSLDLDLIFNLLN